MQTYFEVKRSKARQLLMIFIGAFFIVFGLVYAGIINPFLLILGDKVPPAVLNQTYHFSFFSLGGILFALLGLALVLNSLYRMFIRPVILTASKNYIDFANESYVVNNIDRFEIVSYFSSGRGSEIKRYLNEYLVIYGREGTKTIDIRHKNIKTQQLIELLKQYYPNISINTANSIKGES